MNIKAIIGLGNPGPKFIYNRHNIGFIILDQLADEYNSTWSKEKNFEIANVEINDKNIILIKPQTFMNNSGEVIPYLTKKGIKAENILVVHDELEKPFSKISIKQSGSARGHNGLRSIIEKIGPDFWRLRFGIGRPFDKSEVPNYVLSNFDKLEQSQIDKAIEESIALIKQNIK